MRGKKLLAAFLLGVGLCFVPVLGYGEINERMYEIKATCMQVALLEARVSYVMRNPTNFLQVLIVYDRTGNAAKDFGFPEHLDTKGKIYVDVGDNREVLSYKSGAALLDGFKKELRIIYSFITHVATNMDIDIVAGFYTRESTLLGYFYQGEYQLWEK